MNPNIKLNIEPIIEPYMEPNIVPNIEPNIRPYIEPNIGSSIEPNIKPNIEPNIEPRWHFRLAQAEQKFLVFKKVVVNKNITIMLGFILQHIVIHSMISFTFVNK